MKNRALKLISTFIFIIILTPVILFSKPTKANASGLPVFDFAGWLNTLSTVGQTTTTAGATTVSAGANTTTAGSTVADTGLHFADEAQKVATELIKVVELKALQAMTQDTVNWINSGFHGSPLFVQNPDSFFTNIGKFEIQTLINTLGYNPNNYPFGQAFALNIINSYKNQFAQNAQSTFSQFTQDPQLLQNLQNFNYGGWNAFLVNTQSPQNNYIGFTMLATQQLAQQLNGTVQNTVQKATNELQQGMGFLSPKICVNPDGTTNNNWNTLGNEFSPPAYNPAEYTTAFPYNPPAPVWGAGAQQDETGNYIGDPTNEAAIQQYNAQYKAGQAQDQTLWAQDNTCQGQIRTTTPGGVVGNQVNQALASQFGESQLGAAIGNSVSAILDAVLNHFMQKGLSQLSSTISGNNSNINTLNYNGQTIGSPSNTVTNGPGGGIGSTQPIVLSDLQASVQQSITETQQEIQLMDNDDGTTPGIKQVLGFTWPEVQALDQCLPGPDLGWQARMDTEEQKYQVQLQTEGADAGAQAATELQTAVSYFKDWISTQMTKSLPDAATYLNVISGLQNTYQEYTQLQTSESGKRDALLQLQSIQDGLNAFTTQPAPGSADEQTMINLDNQYTAGATNFSNVSTVASTQNELNTDQAKLNNLYKLVDQCNAERKSAGWSAPGGATSTMRTTTEQSYFCDAPIVGGYSHGSFVNPNKTPAYPAIPLVNATGVAQSAIPNGAGTTTNPVDVNINCSTVYNSTVLDYKNNLPSETDITYTLPNNTPNTNTGASASNSSSGSNSSTNTGGTSGNSGFNSLTGGGTNPVSIAITSSIGSTLKAGSSQTTSWYYYQGGGNKINYTPSNLIVQLWDSTTGQTNTVASLGSSTTTSASWTVPAASSDSYLLQVCDDNIGCAGGGTFKITP